MGGNTGNNTNRATALLFCLVFAVAFAHRVTLAHKTRACLNGDEAAVGVMAQRISTLGEHTLFPFGNNYGGGHAVKAHIAAALHSLGAGRVMDAVLPEIFFFSLFAALAAMLGYLAGGLSAGALAGLLVVLSPQFIKQSLRPSGYMETLALMALCAVICLWRIESGEKRRAPGMAWGAAMGVITGAAFWWLEFSAPLTAALFIAAAMRWRRAALPALAAWVLCFPLGAAPIIYVNLTGNLSNLKHLASGHFSYFAEHRTFMGFFTRELPWFFSYDNSDWYPRNGVPREAALLCAAVAAGCAAALIKTARAARGRATVVFCITYAAFYAAVYNLSPFRGESARYLLPCEPFLTVWFAAGVEKLASTRRAAPVALAAILAACVLFADFRGMRLAYADTLVNDSTDTNIQCGEIIEMTSMLEASGVKRVYSGDFVKWIIIYETGGRVAAADAGAERGTRKWTVYEEQLARLGADGYIFNTGDSKAPWFEYYMRAHHIPYSRAATREGRYVLYRPAEQVRAEDFISWSRAAGKKMKNAAK